MSKTGDVGGAQNGLSDRTDEQFADGAGRVGAHDDAVDVALADEGENFVGGQTGPHHHLTLDAGVAGALGQRLEMLLLGAGGGGVVVVADAGGLRRGDDQGVIGMKEDEIGAELLGLGERKVKAFSLAGISEAKRMVEGLLQPGFMVAMGTSLKCVEDSVKKLAVCIYGAGRHT